MSKNELNILIKRLVKHDEKALDTLFEATKYELRSFALKILIKKSYVDDVISESYLKIYTKSHTFRDEFNGRNWIYEIVKNTAMDYNRRYAKESFYDVEELPFELIESSGPRAEEIKLALKSLDDIEYRIIRLKIWENYSFEFASSILDLNISTLYRIYNRAIDKLRDFLSY